MKKMTRIGAIAISAAMLGSLIAAPAFAEDELIKVGVTFGDLANPVWADCANTMMEEGPDYGFEVTAVGCDTSNQQIEQIENFISGGSKAIVVGAKDTKSMSDYAQTVLDQDVALFALGYEIDTYTATMLVRNYEVGYAIAAEAADWINERSPDGCEVIINEAPEYDVLVDRVDGMKAALEELAPQAEIVAYVNGTTTAQILPEVENAMTAHPDVKVCIAIGDGGGLAFREGAKGMGLNADDFGVFCVDCTEEVAKAIAAEDCIRAAMSLGGGKLHAEVILETLKKIFDGEEYEEMVPYPEQMVTVDNVAEVAEELGYDLAA